MPIHPHECKTCGCYEVLTLSLRAPIDPTCPKCGKKGERRFGIPVLKTNSAFMNGVQTGMDGIRTTDPVVQKSIVRGLKSRGFSPQGKMHQSGLGPPSDPFSWCADLDEFKRKVKQIGGACPEFNIKGRETPPKESKGVGEDIITTEIENRMLRGELTETQANSEDTRCAVAEQLTPHWKNKTYTPKRKKAKK